MQVREATVGPLSGTLAVSGVATSTRVERQAQRLGHDLREHRARALADLGAGHEDAHAARHQLERGPRGQHHLAGAGEARAVEEEREADAAVRAPPGPALAVEVGALHRLAQHGERGRVLAQHLAGGHRVARAAARSSRAGAPGRARAASATRSMCASTAKTRLRRAEAAEGAVGRRVRHHDAAVDADVVAAVGPGRVEARRARARPGSACSRRRRRGGRRSPSR